MIRYSSHIVGIAQFGSDGVRSHRISCAHRTLYGMLYVMRCKRYANLLCSMARSIFIALFFLVGGSVAYAQESAMTLTITPPLFQVSVQPGETWTSGITVVNSNAYPVTVYAEPVLFSADGLTGRPVFANPALSPDGTQAEPDASTLAGWITVPKHGISIAPQDSYLLPLAISVPSDAPPGGHYASVLITTGSPTTRPEESSVAVTSSMAALIFLRVAGDVREEARIHSFSTDRTLYDKPHARFVLQFKNEGTVHLQPQGDITIYNMFGKKRGYIPVNHTSGYGIVLPESVREFAYEWESETGAWDMGRYRAELTVGFGTEQKSFESSSVTFWVLPLRMFVSVGVLLLLSMWFIGWALRAYVRHALMLERTHIQSQSPPAVASIRGVPHTAPSRHLQTTHTLRALVRPLTEGLVDLRRRDISAEKMQNVSQPPTAVVRPPTILRTLGIIGLFVIACIVLFVFVRTYVREVTNPNPDFRTAEERRQSPAEL